MRPAAGGGGLGIPRPGRTLVILMGSLVAAYVLELILLRADQAALVGELELTPRDVFADLKLWQMVTSLWLHDPRSPGHLLSNLLWLFMFGGTLLDWWKPKRFLFAYMIFGLSGAALTVLVGALSLVSPFSAFLEGFADRPHVGASGAIMGVTVAWGLVFGKRQVNMLFLGPMKGITVVYLAVAVELITALSFSGVSSSSHFGGMIAAFVLVRQLWKPSAWREGLRRLGLNRKKRKLEHDLRVIDGGKDRPKDPREWN